MLAFGILKLKGGNYSFFVSHSFFVDNYDQKIHFPKTRLVCRAVVRQIQIRV